MATCETIHIYQFITNITINGTSFHLWWKETLLNYQKASKYYEHDCRVIPRSLFLFWTANCQSGYINLNYLIYVQKCFSSTEPLVKLEIILKHKQTFYLTWIKFLLIKDKLRSFDWIGSNLSFQNLLTCQLNLKKETTFGRDVKIQVLLNTLG